jgi:hypothetical protein
MLADARFSTVVVEIYDFLLTIPKTSRNHESMPIKNSL